MSESRLFLIQQLTPHTYSTTAAFACLLWDAIIHLNQEYEHIWKAHVGNYYKWLYLFARYAAIANQLLNLVIVLKARDYLPLKPSQCLTYTLVEVIVFRTLLLAMEIVLGIRIYVLYGRRKYVGAFLIAIIALSYSGTVLFSSKILDVLAWDGLCTATNLNWSDVLSFSFMSALRHGIMGFFVFHKSKASLTEHPVVKMITRDFAWVFIGLMATLATLFPFIVTTKVTVQAAFVWPMTIASIACCRLILNIQLLGVNPGSDAPPVVQSAALNSEVEMEAFH